MKDVPGYETGGISDTTRLVEPQEETVISDATDTGYDGVVASDHSNESSDIEDAAPEETPPTLDRPARATVYERTVGGFFPEYPRAENWTQEVWMPTDKEPGQERIHWEAGTDFEHAPYMERVLLTNIETLAAEGMREVFERFGFRSSYVADTQAQIGGVAAQTRDAVLEFPSSTQLRALSRQFSESETTADTTKLSITHVAGDKEFSGVKQIGELAKGNLIMARETDQKFTETFYLRYFFHDQRLHLPAWLCMPPSITVPLREQAKAAIQDYQAAKEAGEPRPLARAEKRIGDMTDGIDGTFTTRAVLGMLSGEDTRFGEHISELLQWSSHRRYEEDIKRHIARPAMRDVLVAGYR